jgi:hypothetical protein
MSQELIPFPFTQQTFCRYEPVEQRIGKARVLVIDSLLRDEDDVSEVARQDWGQMLAAQMRRERLIAGMAVENILNNVSRLVKEPSTEVAHLSEVAEVAARFKPEAIVVSCAISTITGNRSSTASGSSFARQRSRCWQSVVAISWLA